MSGVAAASLWMVGAFFSFTGMALAGRELSAELNTFQILFFRSLIGLIIIGAVIVRTGLAPLRVASVPHHILRNIIHFGGQFGWFFAISILPLAQVFAFEFTVPIWTALLAAFILGERMTIARAGAIAIGFVGILVIARPGMVPFEIGALAALLSAICYATSHTLTKRLTRTDSAIAVIFFMTLLQLPMGGVPTLLDWTTPSLAMTPWLILVGVTGLSAHYCMARAFAHADATVVVPMDFLRLPLIAFLGLTVYHEPLDIWVLAGAAIIFAGNFMNVLVERRRGA